MPRAGQRQTAMFSATFGVGRPEHIYSLLRALGNLGSNVYLLTRCASYMTTSSDLKV